MMSNQSSLSTPSSTPIVNETFQATMCSFVDFPSSGIECSQKLPPRCARCYTQGAYFTGESVNNYQSTALSYYYVLYAIVVIFSLYSFFANILIIKVVRTTSDGKMGSFQLVLTVLAVVDALCSVMVIAMATSFASYLGNWSGRGKGVLFCCFAFYCGAMLFASASAYISILISIKGYLLISFPIRANLWFTRGKTWILTVVTLSLALLLTYPRFVSWTVEKNDWKDVKSFQDLDYIVKQTEQGRYWYEPEHLDGLHAKIDAFAPLPILLLFNLLSFWKVHQLTERRKEMNVKVKQDINAVRMFLPVVIAYFITNFGTFFQAYFCLYHYITYRELYLVSFFCVTINCGVNLPIYYFRNNTFKEETRKTVRELLERVLRVEKQKSISYDERTGSEKMSSMDTITA